MCELYSREYGEEGDFLSSLIRERIIRTTFPTREERRKGEREFSVSRVLSRSFSQHLRQQAGNSRSTTLGSTTQSQPDLRQVQARQLLASKGLARKPQHPRPKNARGASYNILVKTKNPQTTSSLGNDIEVTPKHQNHFPENIIFPITQKMHQAQTDNSLPPD